MSNYSRKLKRIGQRKAARAESRLWTSDDWQLYVQERARLIANGAKREAASRRAWHKVRGEIMCDGDD